MTKMIERCAKVKDLSKREQQVVRLIVRGMARKRIVDELGGMSMRTLEVHIDTIRKKLGVRNDIDLLRFVIREEVNRARELIDAGIIHDPLSPLTFIEESIQ